MESCKLHLILQPFRLLEMRSYALNCTGIKDDNVTPVSLPGSPSITLPIACRQCACFFYDLILHMPRHHTAACIAMQLVTPSNSGKLPGILGVPQCTLEVLPYFQLQLPPNIYVLQHPPLGSRYFPPVITLSGSSHTSTLQTSNSSYFL